MLNITLLKSNDNSSLYNTFSNCFNNEKKNIKELLQKVAYRSAMSEPANSAFTKNYSWEYFSNELEFE